MRTRYKTVLFTLLATLALSGVAAAAASAHEPVWYVKGVEQKAGASESFTSTSGEGKFSTIDYSFICKSSAGTGKIVGGIPGTGEMTITYKECVLEGRTAAECNVHTAGAPANTIKTNALEGKLVWLKETGEQTGVLLKGSTEELFMLEFTPKAQGDCGHIPSSAKVVGQLVYERLPVGQEAVTNEIVFPGTVIKDYWTGDQGSRVRKYVEKLELGSTSLVYVGTAKVTLASKNIFGAFPQEKTL